MNRSLRKRLAKLEERVMGPKYGCGVVTVTRDGSGYIHDGKYYSSWDDLPETAPGTGYLVLPESLLEEEWIEEMEHYRQTGETKYFKAFFDREREDGGGGPVA